LVILKILLLRVIGRTGKKGGVQCPLRAVLDLDLPGHRGEGAEGHQDKRSSGHGGGFLKTVHMVFLLKGFLDLLLA